MRVSRIAWGLVVTAAPLFVFLGAARAQLGLYTLPKDDFRWNWGDGGVDKQRGSPDIEISGGEAQFRCELTARLRPSSSLSPSEIRDLENSLRVRLDFIYAASEALNYLDQNRALDWGVLDCKKPESAPVTEAERAQRENDAREKMLRELDKRRARQQRDDGA
jgi:hypothetical protein